MGSPLLLPMLQCEGCSKSTSEHIPLSLHGELHLRAKDLWVFFLSFFFSILAMCHSSFFTVNNISQTPAQTARHLLPLLGSISMSTGAGCHYELQRSPALAILDLESICRLLGQKLDPCHGTPSRPPPQFLVAGVERWGMGTCAVRG